MSLPGYKMAAHSPVLTCLLAVRVDKCKHFDGANEIKAIETRNTPKQLFFDIHGYKPDVEIEAKCSTKIQASDSSMYVIDPSLSIADLMGFYPLKTLYLKCKTPTHTEENHPEKGIGVETRINAFNLLLAGSKVFPEKKSSCNNRKDELYNDIVEMCINRKLKLHKSVVKDEGSYIIRIGIACNTPVELAFYRADFAKADLCCFCASENAVVDEELKKHFKTVLPMCESCRDMGFKPVHARPFGAKK